MSVGDAKSPLLVKLKHSFITLVHTNVITCNMWGQGLTSVGTPGIIRRWFGVVGYPHMNPKEEIWFWATQKTTVTFLPYYTEQCSKPMLWHLCNTRQKKM